MKHIARKRFGQHFLTDGGIIDAIVDAIHPEPGQAMVEIGPGLAALTQPLVERLGHLTVTPKIEPCPAFKVAHHKILRHRPAVDGLVDEIISRLGAAV